jgi:hypothetical protein
MNPTATQTSSTGAGFVTSILTWLKSPFTSQGSALNWILFVGLLVIAVWFWNHILMQINQDI